MSRPMNQIGGFLFFFAGKEIITGIIGGSVAVFYLVLTLMKDGSTVVGAPVLLVGSLIAAAISISMAVAVFEKKISTPKNILGLLLVDVIFLIAFTVFCLLNPSKVTFRASSFLLAFLDVIIQCLFILYFLKSERVRQVYGEMPFENSPLLQGIHSVSELSSEGNKEDAKGLPVLIGVLLVFLCAAVPFVMNYKYNDNHLNFLNHDYGKNLMMSAERDAVFMTEGGDNQVFSTLYFIYAEKLRPDLSPYDQKGNIFKRIYGDMRYSYAQVIDHRQQIVDAHLFGGEEPFYKDIRAMDDPYFIPYWQGRRPVYLTWQRPEPWTLGTPEPWAFQISGRQLNRVEVPTQHFGDYYYKRYGIMYKVQDVAYSLVDLLELRREMPLQEAVQHFADRLHRPVDAAYAMGKINEMVKKGYIALSGSTLRFVKMYEAPMPGDYFDKMLLRWRQIPNARYFDFLSREIIINYDIQMAEICRDEITLLQDALKAEKNPGRAKELQARIAETWKETKEYYADAYQYGPDSVSVLHNVAVIYLKNDMERLTKDAIRLLEKGLELYPNFWSTYSLYLMALFQDIQEDPSSEEKDLQVASDALKKLKVNMGYYHSTRGDYKKHPNWKNFEMIESLVKRYEAMPMAQLDNAYQTLMLKTQTSPEGLNIQEVQNVLVEYYSRGFPFQFTDMIEKADVLFKTVMTVKKDDTQFLYFGFSLASQLQRYSDALEYGIELERKAGPTVAADLNFQYTMGYLGYIAKRKDVAQRFLNAFIQTAGRSPQQAMQMRDTIANAKQMLSNL